MDILRDDSLTSPRRFRHRDHQQNWEAIQTSARLCMRGQERLDRRAREIFDPDLENDQPLLLTPAMRAAHARSLRDTINEVETMLDIAGIDAVLSGRIKSNYSVWHKMRRKGVSFENIFDLRGIRIIVAETGTCYQVLKLVHRRWQPILSEFDDYIARPKENTYQSLHTTVVTQDGQPLEIQIRTAQMHENAENGAASHQRYKEKFYCR